MADPASDGAAAAATDAEPSPTAEGLRRPASSVDLFLAFNRLALQGFGGVLPIAHRELVERERWLDDQQFIDLLTVGQVLPGPNIINLAIIFGDRFFGWRGALAACAGLLALPLLIVLALAVGYQRFADQPQVAGALRGMGAVAAGLVMATAVKLARTLKTNPLGLPACWALGASTLVMVGFLRWPMVWVVLGLGVLGVATAAWRLGPPRVPGPGEASRPPPPPGAEP
jgi:chromate transporter